MLRRSFFRYVLPIVFLIIFIGGVFAVKNIYEISKEDELLSNYVDSEKGWLDDSDEKLYPRKIEKMPLYYRGEPLSCWLLGETRPIAGAIYYFKDSTGKIIEGQKPIVYLKPGDERYSQFWEIFYVQVPKRYKPNSVKSIDTILKGENDKIFHVSFSGKGVNMPIVYKEASIEQADGYPKKIEGYYKDGQKVLFLQFETDLFVYDNGRIDTIPFLNLRKSDKEGVLSEFIQRKDLNSDGDATDSLSFVDIKSGHPSYSPIMKLSYIYVNSNYPSWGVASPWKSFEEILGNKGGYLDFKKGRNALEETSGYFNCPQAK